MSDGESNIVRKYRARTQRSAALAARARDVLPSGLTHDSRYLLPYPPYVERALGSRKWDVDGHEYVDYAGGHGALLLGHNHPQVLDAVQRQLARGTHFGACHELEIRWAEAVRRLMPAAEKVRFTSSGTEATLLAVRLARAFTGRPKLVRFAGHFHGWHDHMAFGVSSRYDGSAPAGVLNDVAANVWLLNPGDTNAAQRALAAHGDVAAVILEPTGGSWGQSPLRTEFVRWLRAETQARGVLLIFDEVISGFRCAPGGAQEALGIRPDLITLAKILAGGLPGGAVAGRRDILEGLEFGDVEPPAREKISHHGTFNANPLSAAAGVATLELIATTDACARASAFAARLRDAWNEVLRAEGVPWIAYGTYSGFHLFTNPKRLPISAEDVAAGRVPPTVFLERASKPLVHKLRLAMLLGGVDLFSWPGGPTSAVHDDADLERTVDAFRGALRLLRAEGELEAEIEGLASSTGHWLNASGTREKGKENEASTPS